MRTSAAVNFSSKADEPVAEGTDAAHPEEDNLEAEFPAGGSMASSSAPIPESNETEVGAAPVPELDRSKAEAVNVIGRPAVTPKSWL